MSHILAIVLAAILLIFSIGYMNNSIAEKRLAEARAYRIERQADSQYMATLAVTMTPMVLIIAGGFVGGLFAIAAIVFAYRSSKPEVRIIERQIIYALPPGASRRELWRHLSDSQGDVVYLNGGER